MNESTSKISNIITEAESLMILTYGEEYVLTRIKEDDGQLTGFITKDFSLHFLLDEDSKEGLFYLTFIVGTRCRRASEITCLLTTVINYEFIYPLDDFYWDYEKGKMLFGEEAVQKKFDDHIEREGKAKCPACNKILPKEFFVVDKGFCQRCDEDVVAHLTWH